MKKKLTLEEVRVIETFGPMGKWMAGYAMKVGGEGFKAKVGEQFQNFMKANLFLQPKQLEFCVHARECDMDGGPTAVMSGGGRGSSKSHAILAQIFADDCQRYGGLKVLLLRKIGKANQEQVQDYRTKLLAHIQHDYKQQAGEIHFPNGSKVILGNYKDDKDIDRYMGQEYDVIYVMESNQLSFSKKKFILTCLRTSKPNWRPRLYEDTNPGGIGMQENRAMYVLPCRQGRQKETGTRYIHSTVYDNKFINQEYVKQLETLTGWQRKAWLEGDWDFAAGSFFTNFVPEVHVYPNDRCEFNEKDAVRWYASYDFGFAHNAACILFAQSKDGATYVVDEWVDSENVIFEQAQNIHSMLNRHNIGVGDLDFFVAGKDCFSRNEDGKTIADGFDAEGIRLTVAEVDRANGWKRCHALFGDISVGIPSKMFIHSRCKSLITQIQSAQHSEKRAGDIEKFNADSEGNGGDDALDAWRFGVASDPNHSIRFAKPVALTRSPYQLLGTGI